jgi:hypothetical protein
MAANCPIRIAFTAALLVAAASWGCSKPASTSADAKDPPGETGQREADGKDHEHADEHDHAHEADQSVERAIEITTRMLTAYRGAKSYADHGAYVEEAVYRGEGVAHQIPYYEMSVALERPNRLRVTLAESVADDAGQRHSFAIASDGEFLRATLSDIDDQMVEIPAPAKITPANVFADPIIAAKLQGRLLGDLFPQLAMLLNDSDEDEAAIFPHDSHPRLLPTTPLDGRVCHRVATSHPEGTRVLWIDAETSALRRMELPIDAELARIDPEHRYLRLSVRIDFQDPTFDAQIAPAAFALEPPIGARRVRRFVEPADSEDQEKSVIGAERAKDEGEEIRHQDTK